VTELGIVYEVLALLEKYINKFNIAASYIAAPSLTNDVFSGAILMLVKTLHPLNAPPFKLVTDAGMVILARLVLSPNAL
jgi:hypothetical protein